MVNYEESKLLMSQPQSCSERRWWVYHHTSPWLDSATSARDIAASEGPAIITRGVRHGEWAEDLSGSTASLAHCQTTGRLTLGSQCWMTIWRMMSLLRPVILISCSYSHWASVPVCHSDGQLGLPPVTLQTVAWEFCLLILPCEGGGSRLALSCSNSESDLRPRERVLIY